MLNENKFNYPAMLDLQGRECVIIGGGPVAARKLAALCRAGARVSAAAPAFCPELLQLAAEYGCRLVQDVYRPEYLAGAFIVVAATDSAEVNRQVTEAAPCLCNNITEPGLGNFTVPASFVRGDITVALATGGMPAFTRVLKQYLQRTVTPEMAEFNSFLLQQRREVRRTASAPGERTAFWRSVLTEELLQSIAAGDAERAKEKVLNAISSFRTKSQNGSR